jgi:hypothetical protein
MTRMYNSAKIITGIIIFLVLVTCPFWLNLVKPAVPPKLDVGTQEKECVEPTAYMKTSHMVLLNQWRDEAVRNGNGVYVSSTGKKYNISLQNTCTNCHARKEQFCDRCHNYVAVAPRCWDCHIVPKEQERQAAARGDN